MVNYFKDVDLDDVKFENNLKIKAAAIKQKRVLEEFFREDGYKLDYMGQFKEITNGAFGYINNPYRKVPYHYKQMLNASQQLIDDFNDEVIADNLQLFLAMKESGQDYSLNMYRNETREGLKEILVNFQKAIELFEDASKKSTSIFRKYLGVPKLNTKKNNSYWVNDSDKYTSSYSKLTPSKGGFEEKSYSLKEWSIWASSSFIDIEENYEGEFTHIAKKEYPELYI